MKIIDNKTIDNFLTTLIVKSDTRMQCCHVLVSKTFNIFNFYRLGTQSFYPLCYQISLADKYCHTLTSRIIGLKYMSLKHELFASVEKLYLHLAEISCNCNYARRSSCS